MLKVFAAALALAGASPAAAGGVALDTARIDAALSGMVEQGRTVGASVLVWQDGKEVHFNAAGLADREAQRPFARDSWCRYSR